MVASQQGLRPDARSADDRRLPLLGPGGRPLSSADAFAAYQPRIRRYILSIVRDPVEAEDLTQEVFLRAHRKLASVRDPEAGLSWLYRVATNICYDSFRQRSRRPTLDPRDVGNPAVADATPDPGARADVERAVQRSQMSECVRGYVSDLSDDYQQVLRLHDELGMTTPEIAEMLGVSVDAVKIRLHRARRKLQALLADNCDFSHDEHDVFVCDPTTPHPEAPPQRRRPGGIVPAGSSSTGDRVSDR